MRTALMKRTLDGHDRLSLPDKKVVDHDEVLDHAAARVMLEFKRDRAALGNLDDKNRLKSFDFLEQSKRVQHTPSDGARDRFGKPEHAGDVIALEQHPVSSVGLEEVEPQDIGLKPLHGGARPGGEL